MARLQNPYSKNINKEEEAYRDKMLRDANLPGLKEYSQGGSSDSRFTWDAPAEEDVSWFNMGRWGEAFTDTMNGYLNSPLGRVMFGSSNGARDPRGLGSNQQTGGMNLDVQNKQGSRKNTNQAPGHSLLGHFGLRREV